MTKGSNRDIKRRREVGREIVGMKKEEEKQ